MKIAFLGIGLMGLPMARRLIAAGHYLYVYNRTSGKADPLKADGAVVCETPQEAVSQAEIVIFMVSDYVAIQALRDQCAQEAFRGKCVIQMGTILPSESCECAKYFSTIGAAYLESPVLGSRTEASKGRLIIMVGGRRDFFEQCESIFSELGHSVWYFGKVGKASTLKLALNQLIIGLMSAFALSLGIVQEGDVSVDRFMMILRESALYAPTFDKKLTRLLKNNFDDPNFPIKHMTKDVRLIIEQAKGAGLSSDILEAIHQMLQKANDEGLSEKDYSAIYKIVRPSS